MNSERSRCPRLWSLFLCSLGLSLGGCNRQDTECLARLGRKLLDRAQHAQEEIGGKLDLGWKTELSLQERVSQRLRFEKLLADTRIDVKASETEVELRGTVSTPEQRQRALDVAEATLGVEKVTDSLQLKEP
jgi:hypothetical protein